MSGIHFITDEQGNRKSIVLDWEIHGNLIQALMEELQDIATFDEGMKNQEWASFEEIRKIGLDKGVEDKKLKK